MSSKSKWEKPEYAIPITTVIILILFASFSIISYYRNPPVQPPTCAIGECATNLYNGIKTCSSEAVPYTVGYEVCNPEMSCTNSKTLFTYYDPSIGTVPRATCPEGTDYVDCRCMNGIVCPVNISTYWQLVQTQDNGIDNPNVDIAVYTQMTSWTDSQGVSRGPPFNIGSAAINRNSCFISPNLVANNRILPGCESTLTNNKCVSGVLVYYDSCEEGKCTPFETLAQGSFACVNDIDAIDYRDRCIPGEWLVRSNGSFKCSKEIPEYGGTYAKC